MSVSRSVVTAVVSILVCLVPPVSLLSVPSNHEAVRILYQPDGAAFDAYLFGDEWVHWYETTDGYTVIRGADGYWYYAELDRDGRLVPSDTVVGAGTPPGSQHLRPAESTLRDAFAARRGSRQGVQSLASITGTQDIVIILVEFADTPAGEGSTGPHTASYFADPLTGLVLGTNQGKMHDYFDEVSYGQLSVQGTVANGMWHTSSRTELYYGEDCTPGQLCSTEFGPVQGTDNCSVCIFELAREAIQIADTAGFDFSPYDADANGVIDHVIIIHAGQNQAASGGGPDDIWSHWGTIPGGELVDGKLVEGYMMLSEHDAMSVFAHEFSHDLGAPDLYDYDNDSDPVGKWCNMGHNFESSRPPHLCGLLKIDIDADFANGMTGWATPDSLTSTGTYTAARLDVNATGSVVMTVPAFSGGEYFLVENRRRSGYYDFSLPEEGLIFTHVDLGMPNGSGRFNDGPPDNSYHGAWIERPLNLLSPDGAAYSVDDGEHYFDPTAIPNTNANGGVGTGIAFRNIGLEADIMGFDFRPGPTPVGGPLGGSTTWRLENSPYVVQSTVTIADGDSLIIEPGVVVKFKPSTGMVVNGTLIAVGTAADSIVFTSYKDDAHGGDTNGNGPSSGSPGDWNNIWFQSADVGCSMAYCLVRYAGGGSFSCGYNCARSYGIWLSGAGTRLVMTNSVVERIHIYDGWGAQSGGAIFSEGGTTLELSECEVRDNYSVRASGIYSMGALTLLNSRIKNNNNLGVYAEGNGTVVTGCRITSNGWSGLYLTGSSCQVVADTLDANGDRGVYCPNLPTQFRDNVSTGNGGFGYYVPAGVVHQIGVSNITLSNGRNNAVAVAAGSITSSTQWLADQPYAILGSLTVTDNVTLTLEAGVVMKFNTSTSMIVNGTLIAVGTAADSIVFTSYKDDAHGGDTNGNGPSSGSPGDWNNIWFQSADVGCSMAYCLVRYAGGGSFSCGYNCARSYGIWLSGAGTRLVMTNSVVERIHIYDGWGAQSGGAIFSEGGTTLELSECEVRDNYSVRASGIYSMGALTLLNSRIKNNNNLGVYAEGNGTVVTGCRITSNGWSGLYLTGSSCQVVADTLDANGDMGVYCPNLPTQFRDNVSTGNGGFGYYVPADVVDRVWLANVMGPNGRNNAIGVTAGSIVASTQWIDEHPYAIFGNITVPDNITFTLEAGVVMKFSSSTSLTVNGILNAVGAEGDTTVFTSYKDDAHGGDTNGNGPSSGSPGDWNNIWFQSADVGCSMAYCLVRYAGGGSFSCGYNCARSYGIWLSGAGTRLVMTNSVVERIHIYDGWGAQSGGAIFSEGGTTLELSECEVRDNYSIRASGIYSMGALTLLNSRIRNNNNHGVYAEGNGTVVTGCRITSNGWSGLYLWGSSCHVVADTLLTNGGHGLLLGQLPAEFYGNYSADNRIDEYVLPMDIVDEAWLSNETQLGGAIGVWGGSLTTPTVWIDEHPYDVWANITVPHDITLTLEPGVVMKFRPYYNMTVNGTLVANGTQDDWITFTSYRDDSYGGDTNGDGPSSGVRGDWLHLIFDNTNAGSSMQYCRVRFAGASHGAGNNYREAVIANGAGAQLVMTNCVVEETGGGAWYSYAVAAYGGSDLQMLYCEARNNGGNGFFIAEPTAVVTGCVASDNKQLGFYVHPELAGEIAKNDTLRNNGYTNSIGLIGGAITLDDEWPKTYTYLVTGSITINAGATLIIDKGSVVKFMGNQGIEVRGGLVALGDPSEKIIFTSYRNDAYGGDTNEDRNNSNPAPGDWGQLHFNGAVPASKLGWVVVSYAGYGNAAALRVNNCSLAFSECIIHDNQHRGVLVTTTGELTLTNSDIYKNPSGLENQNTTKSVDARYCWWGSPSGPSGVGPGTGDPVSNYVLYDPWLDRSIDNPWVAFTSPSTSGNYRDVLIFDLDGDPLMDLIAATEQSGMEIYIRTGFEQWQIRPSPITTGQVLALAKGDFNNDNRDDLLACGPFGIRCFKGTGTALLESAPPLVGSICNDVMFANLNHDQYLDVVGCSGNNAGIWVFYGDSLGNWTPGIRPTTTGTYNRIRSARINDDAWWDIAATSAEYHGIQIWYGSEAGTWTKAPTLRDGSAFFGLDLGDIDKDGDWDIAVGSNSASLGIQIYLNDGVGGWTQGIAPTSTGLYNDVVLADLNGDTRLDLAAASQGSGINVWVGTSNLYWNFWYHPIKTHNFNRICVDDFTLNGSLDMAAAASVVGLALWDNLTPGVRQEYFATTPSNLAFGKVAIGKCAHEWFQLENVSPDTLRNVVVYTTNPAFSVTLDPPNVQPFDLLPTEVRNVKVSYCPVATVVENEVIMIHSSVAVTNLRATGEGVTYIQPLWSMKISVENAAGAPDSIGLEFGGGIGATDGLDAAAGELCLPPLPPSPVFDARFLITGCEGSLVNIHDYYAETDSFILQWQAGDGGYPVTVSWDPNSLPDGTFLISDLMGGVFIDTLNMADTSHVVIPPAQSFITQLSITTLRKSTFANYVHRGWQIRSLAVSTDRDSLQHLFPGAISAFTWADGYVQVKELGVGIGYWVNMPKDTVVSHVGDQVRRIRRNLPVGWSLVGTVFDTVAVADIQQSPPSSIVSIYGFRNRYELASLLVPGQGYWFNLNQPCEITITVPSGGSTVSETQTIAGRDTNEPQEGTAPSSQGPYSWRFPLTVQSASLSTNASTTLVIGFDEKASDGIDLDLGERDVPPWPPSTVFESRLRVEDGNGLYTDLRKPDAGVYQFDISWQIGEGGYPVTATWDPQMIPEWATLILNDNVDGSFIGPIDMKKVSSVAVGSDYAAVSGLRITAEIEQTQDSPVTQFALFQNVPNPFNPRTTIRFDLPEQVHVKLRVYDVFGRVVRTLVDRTLPRGRHAVDWAGHNDQGNIVASGIYFYRIEAGTWTKNRKLVLLK